MERFIRLIRILIIRKIGDRADLLLQKSQGSHSHTMTLYLIAREMLILGEELSPYLLREILMKASRRVPGYAEFVRHIGDVRTIASFTGNDFMSSILSRCKRLQMDEVAELLSSTPPHKKIYHSDDLEKTSPAQDYVPLGVRKSMARRFDPKTLENLLTDQNPAVIRHVLNNPRSTEEMIMKSASLRPTSPEVLEEIFNHEKWGSRYRIRKSLVFNPYSPPRISHALLPLLLMQDLMDVSLSRVLHPNLYRASKRVILHRIAEMPPGEKKEFSRVYSNTLKRIFLEVG